MCGIDCLYVPVCLCVCVRVCSHLFSIKHSNHFIFLVLPGDISIDEETEAYSPWSSNAIPGLASKQRPGLEAQGWAGEVREGGSAAAVFSRLARSPISEEVLEALRSADRKGRDVVVGLSNACCKWGCSKSEISSLC